LTNDKIDFLKTQHKETLQLLKQQHIKEIEDFTKIYEEKLKESIAQFQKIEKQHKLDLEARNHDYQIKYKEFEEEKDKIKAYYDNLYKKKMEEELEKKENEAKFTEKAIEESYERKIAFTFERMHKEYEEQMANYEMTMKNYELEGVGLRETKIKLEEELKSIKENRRNMIDVSTEMDFNEFIPKENKSILGRIDEKIIEKNHEKNYEKKEEIYKEKKICLEKGINTSQENCEEKAMWEGELGVLIEKIEGIVAKKNKVIEKKNQEINDLKNKLEEYDESFLSINVLKEIMR